MLEKLHKQLKDLEVDKAPTGLKFKNKNVDVWLEPKYVWEVKAADMSLSPVYCAAQGDADATRGIALRFPRFIRERDDKNIEDSTSAD